ncbi:barnase inhibitor [Brevibacillus fluminis]|uniref:Barnase inhibitor n=1 Tax=Brevibacillus fluminis TaxID=511487 RepID=A0A3M8DQ21_9BACL|nr:barstar family protein [Brevibacillus fluminis]RNB89619.1 barnase inhibitor [Brevibacillus fluminis]
MSSERVFHITIDVSGVRSKEELHLVLKSSLKFPDFYGMNLSAFWDAITGLVEMPSNLTFLGWNTLKELLPDVAQSIEKTFEDYNDYYPDHHTCNVIYK